MTLWWRGETKTHLSRAQNGYAADLSLKAHPFVHRPLHAVSVQIVESPAAAYGGGLDNPGHNGQMVQALFDE
jgi:hypothetical protein